MLRSRAALVLAAILWVGCASYQHASSADTYAERCLSLRSGEGAERLQIEMRYDRAVRQFVHTHGQPDYLYIADRSRLYLFYLSDDMGAAFQRGLLPPAEVTKVDKIPGSLLTLLPKAEQKRVLARRKGRSAAVARASTKKKPRRTARSVPAAPAPTSHTPGMTISYFEVNAIVERLARPMSAADPGVNGWRRSRLADGTVVRSGKIGSTKYVVTPHEVSVRAAASSKRRSTPGALRVGYIRVNNAIFGGHADRVSQAVESLVARVASDPSGRTRLASRMFGRTVQITRAPSRGLLVYSVRSE